MSAIESALAYAAQLDALLAGHISDETEETLVFRVGDLLGGLSIHGFAADLKAELQRVEEREYESEDAEGYRDWVRQLFWPSERMLERVDRLKDEAAMRWEREARALMAPHGARRRGLPDADAALAEPAPGKRGGVSRLARRAHLRRDPAADCR